MADQVVPVTDLDKVGLVADTPPMAIPPNGFSDCRNVRFRESAVQKMRGDVDIFPNVIYEENDVLKYIVWWPNPNLAIDNQGYYLLIINRGNADLAFMVKADQAPEITDLRNTNIPEYKGTFLPDGNWQHTFFQGGFALIINNGLEAPRYVLDAEDNVNVANVGQDLSDGSGLQGFTDLPGWDSYAVDAVDVGTVTAGVIRTFGDLLIAGNLVERDADNTILRALPNTIRTSDIAAPGAIPQNWNPFAEAVNTADEFTVTGDGIVQDFIELQGNMYVYSNSSISVVSRTGNPVTPISVRPVTSAYGALTTDSVIEFDGRHFVVGSRDIYLFGGHPGSIQTISEDRIRDYFYDAVNNNSLDNIFVIRYQPYDEIWLCFPSQSSLDGRANEALIWNYRKNTWTKRDLNGAFSGVVGPVPGGGIPRAGFVMIGNGNDNEIVPGLPHQVTLDNVTEFDRTSPGYPHVETIDVTVNQFISTDGIQHDSPSYAVTLGSDFFTGSGANERPTVRCVIKYDVAGFEQRYSISLPVNLGDNAAYGSSFYGTSVRDVIVETIINAMDGDSNVNVYAHSDNTSFIVEFPNNDANKVDGLVRFYAPGEIRSIRDVDSSDRPMEGGVVDDSKDVEGDSQPDPHDPNLWPDTNTVFSFDLSHLTDNIHDIHNNELDDYIFFLRGAKTGDPNEEYLPLPSGISIYPGEFTQASIDDVVDGGDNSDNDGETPGDPNISEDGGRRFNYSFVENGEFRYPAIDITAPITATVLRTMISNAGDQDLQDTTEVALLVDADDFEALSLVVYRVRPASDGVADYDVNSPCALDPALTCNPMVRFLVDESVYNKAVLTYVSAYELPVIAASLTTNKSSDADVKADYEKSIQFAMSESYYFHETSDLVYESFDSKRYLWNVEYNAYSVDVDGNVTSEATTPGQVKVGGQDGAVYAPPCIRVSHEDPNGIEFFSFETDLVELDGTDVATLKNQIASSIRNEVRMWSYDAATGLFESRETRYNEALGDTGVPYPKEDGTFLFNENREHDEFRMSFYEGNIMANADKAPTFELTQPGVYDRFDGEGWGSYVVILMSNNISYLFYLDDEEEEATEQLREQIATRIPGVQLTVENGFTRISPTVIGDNTIFVQEIYMNSEANIEDFRRLLEAPYIQDINNPQLPVSLPESVLEEQPADPPFPFTEANEPRISNNSITTEFDFDRTWSDGAVNFAVEFPLFAAGRVFPDNSSVNAVLASEIGYTFPRYTNGQIIEQPYESYVERKQMAMAPEFTTESVNGVALWTDGSTQTSFEGNERFSVLQMDLSTTNNPGQSVDLDNPQYSNTFYVSEDYKMDIRLTGRFLNWRLSDKVDGTIESPGGKTFSQRSDWRVSGFQWKIRSAGRR